MWPHFQNSVSYCICVLDKEIFVMIMEILSKTGSTDKGKKLVE